MASGFCKTENIGSLPLNHPNNIQRANSKTSSKARQINPTNKTRTLTSPSSQTTTPPKKNLQNIRFSSCHIETKNNNKKKHANSASGFFFPVVFSLKKKKASAGWIGPKPPGHNCERPRGGKTPGVAGPAMPTVPP